MSEVTEPYVDRPMVDERGRIVGTSRTKLRDLLTVEVHVDEVGTCWTPPTAWAYAQACRVREVAHAEAAAMRSLLRECQDKLGDIVMGEGLHPDDAVALHAKIGAALESPKP